MSKFEAEGNLVITNIENSASADLQDEFAVNASDVASNRGRSSRGQSVREAVDHLDRTVDLAETRNDLLRELLDTNESHQFQRARMSGRTLGTIGSGIAGVGGAIAGISGALSGLLDSFDFGLPGGGEGQSSETSAAGAAASVAVTATDVIAQGATVTPAHALAGQATVTAADVVQDKARVTPESVISEPAVITAANLIAQGATVGPSSLIGSTAAVAASDLIEGPVAPEINDIIDPVSDISASDVLKAMGAGGAAAGAKRFASGVNISGSGAGGVGAPPVILPQLLDTLNDFTSQDLPGFDAGRRGRRRPTRETTVNNETTVTVQQDASLDRREKEDIVDSTVEEVKSSLERRL